MTPLAPAPAQASRVSSTLPHEQQRTRLAELVKGWVHEAVAGTLSAEEFAARMREQELDPRYALEHLRSRSPQEILVLSQALTAVNAHIEAVLTGREVVHDHGVIVTRRPLRESAA